MNNEKDKNKHLENKNEILQKEKKDLENDLNNEKEKNINLKNILDILEKEKKELEKDLIDTFENKNMNLKNEKISIRKKYQQEMYIKRFSKKE